jgi:hypothetical protein
MARKATAAATLRAYKADWTHFAQWCAAHGFVAAPAAPATVGASLAGKSWPFDRLRCWRYHDALYRAFRFDMIAFTVASQIRQFSSGRHLTYAGGEIRLACSRATARHALSGNRSATAGGVERNMSSSR